MCIGTVLSATIYVTKTIQLWKNEPDKLVDCYSGQYFDSTANYCYSCPSNQSPSTEENGNGNPVNCVCDMGYATTYADCSSVSFEWFVVACLIC